MLCYMMICYIVLCYMMMYMLYDGVYVIEWFECMLYGDVYVI